MNGRFLPTSRFLLAWLALATISLICGCGRGPSPAGLEPQAATARRVLDFRLGWFHTATGGETLRGIAARYERDPELVAILNRGAPESSPASNAKIYIPPVDDREQVRALLTRIHAQPDKYIVPQIPWNPSLLQPSSTTGLAIKPAESGIKRTVSDQLPVSHEPRRPAAGAQAPAELKPGQGDALKQVVGGGSPANAASARPSVSSAPRSATKPSRAGGSASSSSFQWPVQGEVVTKFKGGNREGNFKGIEIAAEEGAAVKAARPGKVLLADELLNYGNLVILDHGDGFVSVYGYNQELLVRKGQQVRGGEEIARVGRQYRWREPQLFFQIRKAGSREPIDPLTVLN